MFMFNPVVSYVPGKSHHVADALSQQPKFHFMLDEEDCMSGVYEQSCCHASSHEYARDDPKMAPLFTASSDADYRKMVVPPFAQKEVLRVLHLPYVGVTKTHETAWSI